MPKFINLPFSIYIVLGLVVGTCTTNLFFLSAALLFITGIFIKKQWPIKIFNTLLFSVILASYLARLQVNSFNDLKSQLNQKTFNITGTVIEYEKIEDSFFKHKIIIQASLLENQTQKIATNKSFAIYTQKFPRMYLGEQVVLQNLKFNFSNDLLFENYLIKNKLAASVFTNSLDFKILKDSPVFLLNKYKLSLLKKINSKMNDATKIMFNSIFAGYKNNHRSGTNRLKSDFQTWGIIHYLARSGLHLVIISTIWQTLCTVLKVPIALSNLVILLFMLLFYALTWSAIPFMRALIMIVCYRICNLLKLQVHLLHILNISCIFSLLNNPISIFFLDFQLSFLLTYGLIFFNEISYMKNKRFPKNSIACKS